MPNPAVTVRRAVAADGEPFLALVDALADYEHLPRPAPDARQRLLRDAFAERPRFELYLADHAGVTAAYAVTFETYSTFLALPTLYLEDLFVLPDHRQHGVGSALFRHCVALAHNRGCGRMEWAVLDWNQLAIDFYERRGAKRLKEWLSYRMVRSEMEQLLARA